MNWAVRCAQIWTDNPKMKKPAIMEMAEKQLASKTSSNNKTTDESTNKTTTIINDDDNNDDIDREVNEITPKEEEEKQRASVVKGIKSESSPEPSSETPADSDSTAGFDASLLIYDQLSEMHKQKLQTDMANGLYYIRGLGRPQEGGEYFDIVLTNVDPNNPKPVDNPVELIIKKQTFDNEFFNYNNIQKYFKLTKDLYNQISVKIEFTKDG